MKKIFLCIVLLCVSVSFAAVDTANKRRAAAGTLLYPQAPFPDGTIDANDRGQIVGIYPVGSVGGAPSGATGGAAVGVVSRNLDKYVMQKRSKQSYVYASVVLLMAMIGYEFERKIKC
jgi:hypothetical protein